METISGNFGKAFDESCDLSSENDRLKTQLIKIKASEYLLANLLEEVMILGGYSDYTKVKKVLEDRQNETQTQIDELKKRLVEVEASEARLANECKKFLDFWDMPGDFGLYETMKMALAARPKGAQ